MKLTFLNLLLGAQALNAINNDQIVLKPHPDDAEPPSSIIVGVRGKEGLLGFGATPPKLQVVSGDASTGASQTLWEWTPDMISDNHLPDPLKSCIQKGVAVTEAKWATNGRQIVAVVNNAALVISHNPGATHASKDKEVIFGVCISSTHTVEMLPNNLLAVATSGGSPSDGIDIYDTTQIAYPPKTVQRIIGFPAVHGILWDEAAQKVWAVGNDVNPNGSNGTSQGQLRGYPFNGKNSGNHDSILDETRVEIHNVSTPIRLDVEWTGKDAEWWNGPHDLAGITDSRVLFITSDVDIYAFNISSGTFLDNEDAHGRYLKGFKPVDSREGTEGKTLPRSDVKSISVNARGYVLYVQSLWKTWYGDRVSIIGEGVFQRNITVSEGLYKSRWFGELPGWPTAR